MSVTVLRRANLSSGSRSDLTVRRLILNHHCVITHQQDLASLVSISCVSYADCCRHRPNSVFRAAWGLRRYRSLNFTDLRILPVSARSCNLTIAEFCSFGLRLSVGLWLLNCFQLILLVATLTLRISFEDVSEVEGPRGGLKGHAKSKE